VLDSFFDLGGSSLLGVRLVSEINKTLHRDLRVLTLFQQPTIEQLAKILSMGSPSKDLPAVFSLRSGGAGLPLFFVAAAGPWQFIGGLLGDRHPIFAIDSYSLRRRAPQPPATTRLSPKSKRSRPTKPP
jgi:hypothetical protein